MRFDILTIFPDFFSGPLDHGILSRAITTGAVEVATHDLRAFTHDRHRTVDDRPFGGGEGMVLKAQPILECVESLPGIATKPDRDLSRQSVILLSAQGKRFTQATAHRLATLEQVVLVCGRYEGVDERVCDLLADVTNSPSATTSSPEANPRPPQSFSMPPLACYPASLGHADSNRYESFGIGDDPADSMTPDGVPRSTHGAGGLLDYPHYTRPAEFRGVSIPEVLGGGDHSAIRRWRRQMALEKTFRNRPDLLVNAAPQRRRPRIPSASLT